MAASKKSAPQKPIVIAKSKQGSLHKALGVPADKPIPAAKLAAAKNSKSAAIRKKAQFAANAKQWNHPTKKGK